jgi:sorbitol-specific phosphotransferase system component IIC
MDEGFVHFFQDGGKEFEKYLEGPLNLLVLVPSNLRNGRWILYSLMNFYVLWFT